MNAKPEPSLPDTQAGLAPGQRPGLPWLAATLISLLIVLATAAAAWLWWRAAERHLELQMHASAYVKAQRLADWHRERLATADRLQHRTSLEQLWVQYLTQPDAERLALLDGFFISYADAPSVQRVELFDASGASLWDSAGIPTAPHPLLLQGLQQVLAQRRASVVGPWRDAQGRVRLAYVGLLDPPGHPTALVALHVDPPPYFHSAVLQWGYEYGPGAQACVFTLEDGAVQFWTDQASGAVPQQKHPSTRVFAQALLHGLAEPARLLRGQHEDGHPTLALLLPVPETPWWVQVEIDRSALWAQAQTGLIGIGWLGLLAMLLALGGTSLLLHRQRLASSQRSLAAIEQANAALRTSEARNQLLSQVTAQSAAAVIITDAQECISYVNPAFERMSGYRAEQVLGRHPRLLRSGRNPAQRYVDMWQALRSGQTWQGELVNQRADGSHYAVASTMSALRDAQQQVLHYVSVQIDVTAQRDAEAQVELLAWFDPLTGLPNRQRLLADLAQALRLRSSNGAQAGLLIVNVDRFKAINDALGRQLGDEVLQALAQRLRQAVGAGELLVHMSGDEFAWLLPKLDHASEQAAASLLRCAARWHSLLEEPLAVGTEGMRVTLSVGATLLEGIAPERPSEALRRADIALHQAKAAGGRQTVFFDPHMGQWAAERLRTEQELRRGIERDELRLFLQPQVDTQGRMVSAEALVRWQHPQRGLLAPLHFITLAEESGLIEPLGAWVLNQACGWIGRLRAQGLRLPISVNVSPRQFQQPDFAAHLLELLQRHQAPAHDLRLEFTENLVLQDVERVVERMHALARAGVSFAIDDFGTGYSSLSYLKNLPIQELKIDRSFVRDAPSSPSDAALVAAMLAVADLMQLRVVAEGVETDEQALLFRSHPGALMQGYLFGRPEPAEDLIGRWLQEQGTADPA